MNEAPPQAASQKAKLLQAFQQGFALTYLDGHKLCGTLSFPRRIADLIKDGHKLQGVWVTVNKKRVKQWYLPNSEPQQQRITGL